MLTSNFKNSSLILLKISFPIATAFSQLMPGAATIKSLSFILAHSLSPEYSRIVLEISITSLFHFSNPRFFFKSKRSLKLSIVTLPLEYSSLDKYSLNLVVKYRLLNSPVCSSLYKRSSYFPSVLAPCSNISFTLPTMLFIAKTIYFISSVKGILSCKINLFPSIASACICTFLRGANITLIPK